MSSSTRVLPSERVATDSAAAFRRRVEPAPGQEIVYDSRDTVAKALLGERGADRLWGAFYRGAALEGPAAVVVWSVGIFVGTMSLFNPSFSFFWLSALCVALTIPANLLFYLHCNLPLLRQALGSFDALFLTAQIIIMCVGEAGSLGWGPQTLFFFGVLFPSYFSIVVSDACHRHFRPRLIVLYCLGFIYCGVLIAVLLVNSLNAEKIEVTVLNLWAFSYPVSRMAFSAIMTVSLLLSKIIFRFWRHPEQLAMLRAPMVISRAAASSAAAAAVWDAAAAERALCGLQAAAALGGRAALEQLLLLQRSMDAAILRALDGQETAGGSAVVAVGPSLGLVAAGALGKGADGLTSLGAAGAELV